MLELDATITPASAATKIGLVEKKSFTTTNFYLRSGAVLAQVTIAYETYGRLATDGRNAILVAHGYTNNHHAAGRYAEADPQPGWWDGVIGPGKAIDTNRFFVVSSNMLGSSYGSTNPSSPNPATGKPYGPDFPEISVEDIVTAQKALIDALGVRHLAAVAGRSYGGFQAFAWGYLYREFVNRLIVVSSGPRSSQKPHADRELLARFAADPNWNGGWYYDHGGIVATMIALRVATLKRYGIEAKLAEEYPEPAAREAAIRKLAEGWGRNFDANGMLALLRAQIRFNAELHFDRIRAKVLYVLVSSDELYPPTLAPGVMAKLQAAGVDATYFMLDSPYGHDASTPDAAKWAPILKEFLANTVPAG